jgi:type II secretory pathway predicted ATPase ExeA
MVAEDHPFAVPAFTGSLEPAAFHVGPVQEEALARLEWLVADSQRCGLVVADEGTGKSHLLAAAVRRLGGLGAEVAVLSLGGLPEGEWLDLLLGRLPLHPLSRAEVGSLWQKLEDRLRENTLMERPTVLLFDDLDRAPADAAAGIARLVAAVEPRFSRTVVVATTTAAGLAVVPEAIRQRAAVRIELPAWTEAETADYLAAELTRCGGDPASFSPQAAATVSRFAGGTPRGILRLARLALAAAAADGATHIDAATVERVWRELAPEGSGLAAAGAHAEDDPPANPQVRVVRRLWG